MNTDAFDITGKCRGTERRWRTGEILALIEQTYEELADPDPGYNSHEERLNWAMSDFAEALSTKLETEEAQRCHVRT